MTGGWDVMRDGVLCSGAVAGSVSDVGKFFQKCREQWRLEIDP